MMDFLQSEDKKMPTIAEIGLEARKIDPAAFAADIRRGAPDREKWINRRTTALAKAREVLTSIE